MWSKENTNQGKAASSILACRDTALSDPGGQDSVRHTQAYRQQDHPLFLLLLGGSQVAGVL